MREILKITLSLYLIFVGDTDYARITGSKQLKAITMRPDVTRALSSASQFRRRKACPPKVITP
jgi:hypothetical protein